MIQAAVEASPSRCITMSMRSRPSFITTNAVSALMFASESVTRAPHAHACAGVGNQEVATMNSRPRQMRRAFFTRIRVLGGRFIPVRNRCAGCGGENRDQGSGCAGPKRPRSLTT